jgi:hypothetical protein
MPNRRESIHDFYKSTEFGGVLQKALPLISTSSFPYRGPGIADSAVARADLNGYSEWSRDRPALERALLLDDFFSYAVPEIDRHGGVFFRDEGDCVVALFSTYFNPDLTTDRVERYCMRVGSQTYGSANLTASVSLAFGNVAFFQKRHEIGTDDWSAEGEPFVTSARIEAALTSIPQVVMLAEDYRARLASSTNRTPPGASRPPFWLIGEPEPMQIQGLGRPGGWVDVVKYTKQRGL